MFRRLKNRVYKRLGYRGLFLILFGAMFILIGAGIPFGATSGRPDPALLHTNLPYWISITHWCGVGLFAMVVAVWHRFQVYGFALLVTAPLLRFISYAVAFYRTLDVDFYDALRWVPASALYFLISLTIALFASWPEPPDQVEAVPPPLTPEAQALLDEETSRGE